MEKLKTSLARNMRKYKAVKDFCSFVFIYFWLSWVSVAARLFPSCGKWGLLSGCGKRGPSLAVVSGGSSLAVLSGGSSLAVLSWGSSLAVVSRASSLVAVCGFLIAVASLFAARGLWSERA